MIVLTNLGKNYGPKSLFEGVDLQLGTGHRYGLVGANGSGKTTLLRILAQEESASTGNVGYPKNVRLGFLRQDQFSKDDQRIVDVAMEGDREVAQALRELDALEHTPHTGAEAKVDAERIAALTDILATHDGYTLEPRTREMLVGLGIEQQSLDQPLGTLSGGFKLRVLLAQVLLSRPDVMLLDEPTNHLDILSIRWMETFLQNYKGCAVIISHDRRFLDAVATDVLDVDYETVIDYPGNYSQFVALKQATRDRKEIEIARAEKEIAHKQAFVERFKAQATKARQAQSRIKQIEKIEVEHLPRTSRQSPHFRFDQRVVTGKDVLRVEGVSKAFGAKRVLAGVGFGVQRGERVAIIGANGIGKSTLLKILTDNLAPDVGTHEWGHNVEVGYFAQDHRELLKEPRQTPLNFVWDACPGEPMTFVRGQLGRLLFSGDEVEKPASALSGGEAARVVFARIAVQKPNVLVLDEPTNHLDLEAIEALTDALAAYSGTLIFVSHNRYVVARLATRVIELRRDGLHDFRGGYDEYLSKAGDDHLDTGTSALKAKATRNPQDEKRKREQKVTQKLSWEEQKLASRQKLLPKQRDRLMAQIEAAEKEKAAIAARYADPKFYMSTPFADIEKLQARQKELDRDIEKTMAEWEAVEKQIAAVDSDTDGGAEEAEG